MTKSMDLQSAIRTTNTLHFVVPDADNCVSIHLSNPSVKVSYNVVAISRVYTKESFLFFDNYLLSPSCKTNNKILKTFFSKNKLHLSVYFLRLVFSIF